MLDLLDEMPEKLTDSFVDLLKARREDTYHGILDIDKKYSKCKDIVEKHIDKIRGNDAKAAEALEDAISYIEERIMVNLYNKGLKDGQEFKQLAAITVEIKS